MSQRIGSKRAVVIAAVSVVAAMGVQTSIVSAANKVWDGAAGTTAGTLNGNNVNYYTWDTVTANWTGSTFVIGDTAEFNSASGEFLIRSASATLDPANLNFTGGAATYDFLRANTTQGSNTYAGWSSAGFTPTPQQQGLADGFGASQFTDANLVTTSPFITMGSSFTGVVKLRQRPVAVTGSAFTLSADISGGTLEIHDGSALPANTQNAPAVQLSGGTFAVNIDTGSYTYRAGNTAPSTAQLGGALTVTASSALSNTAIDAYGRAREQGTLWNGTVNIASGTTLTVNTGGGTSLGNNVAGSGLSGTGTLKIGAAAANSSGANRLKLNGTQFSAGSATLNFDLGASGILTNGAAINGTTNLGSLTSNSSTTSFLGGTTNNATAAGGAATISIGANGSTTTFAGTVTNGSAVSTSGGSPAGTTPVSGFTVANTNITKAGAGTLTFSGANSYSGSTTVSAGTLKAGSTSAFGNGAGAVSVATGATVDFAGNTQVAGKSYTLSGGSLINSTGTATIGTGVSLGYTSNATTGSGAWAADSTGLNTGTTPTVSITGGGGSGATAQAMLQLGWIRFQTADGGNPGSGYTIEPTITFSAPDLAGGRPIKAVLSLTNSASTGTVAGITVIDPGYGYTSIPTVTIDNTGTGGTGLKLVYSMTANGINLTNAGSGYTSAPTMTVGGTGYLANSFNPTTGFGSVAVSATSNIGGDGTLNVAAAISGAGGLNKVGVGTTTLSNANNYAGATDVQAGTFSLASGSLANGKVTVRNAATFAMNSAAAIKFNIAGTTAGTFDVFTQDAGGVFTLDGTLNPSITTSLVGGESWDLFALTTGTADGFDAINLSGLYTGSLTEGVPGLWTGNISGLDFAFTEATGILSVLAVPEPGSMAVLALGAMGLMARRRKV